MQLSSFIGSLKVRVMYFHQSGQKSTRSAEQRNMTTCVASTLSFATIRLL